MRVLSFKVAGSGETLGAEVAGRIVALSGSMTDVLGGGEALQAAQAEANEGATTFRLDEITYLPPVPRPQKIICVGLNYKGHIEEMGRDLPPYPVIFAKYANVLVGHRGEIPMPTISSQLDFEAELGVVIGKRAKNISRDEALSVVGGYTCFNDVSVRDYQRRTIQFLQGKTFDGTGPCGPVIVTADDIPDPNALDISLRLNGETMQHSNTRDMVFDVPTLIETLSQIMTLEPGDIIATGTPAGVGAGRDPKVFMKPGDVVEVEIEGIGVLRNTVR